MLKYMFLLNSVYPFTHDEAPLTLINDDHNHFSRYKSYNQKDKSG